MKVRLLISGSREGFTYKELEDGIKKHFPYPADQISEIVAGGAKGIDTYARDFAYDYQIPFKECKADWDNLGKKAGCIRNIEMADYVKDDEGVLIGFCYNYSKGTTHMLKYAKQIDLKTFVFHKEKSVDMFN